MAKWHKSKWDDESTRPTEPGLYRVLLAGFDCPDSQTYMPDEQLWANLYWDQDYKSSDEKDFFADSIPDGDPYLMMRVEHSEEEADKIIAWHGPVVLPYSKTWNVTDPDKSETLPKEPGIYRVLIVGDSECCDGYTIHEYDDYEIWMEVRNTVDGPEIRCEFDEEPDWIISWHGPINIPEVDCYA